MQTTKVFVNGTFDVLHPGHFRLLEYASFLASLNGVLYVAIDDDQRVKEKKGEGRPKHTSDERSHMLSRIKGVDYVYTFGSDDELRRLIGQIRPKYMVVGSDWKGKEIIGSEYADEVKYFDRIPGHSTTEILGEE